MHPLDGTKLKIIGAKKQLDSFYGEIDLFWKSGPPPGEVIPDNDSEHPFKEVTFKIHREPPAEWGLIVGEIAYNLRSALDHLAWQLALLTTNKPVKRTEFPIFNRDIDFKNSAKGKMVNIPIQAHPVIESLQPYNRGKWPPVESLWWLHEINIVDKHREIIPCFTQSTMSFDNRPGVVYRPNKRLHNDDRIELPPFKGATQAKIGMEIAFDIPTFDSPFPAGRLISIHKFISEEVIPRFEVFF